MLIDSQILYTVAGVVVGIFVGMLGVGGGALMTPILIFLFKIPPSTAVAIDLIYAFSTKTFAVLLHKKSNGIEKCVLKYVGISGAIGAIIGALVFASFSEMHTDTFNIFIKIFVGFVLAVSSLLSLIFMQRGKHDIELKSGNVHFMSCSKRKIFSMLIVGFIVGIVVSMTSVGSGAIITLFLLYVWHIPVKRIVGTGLAIAIIIVGISSFAHLFIGNSDLHIASFLIFGGVFGVYIGEHIHSKLADEVLEIVFIVVLLVLGLLMLLKNI